MRPRTAVLVLLVAAVLAPVACSTSHHQASPSRPQTTAQVTVTTEGGGSPWITEIATAKVPQVQVLSAEPGAATTSTTAPPASPVPAIPRDGLNSDGVVKTPTGSTYANPTYFGNPLVFDVVRDDGAWLEVSLLARPNHETGWIRRSDVTLSTTQYHLLLQLSTFDLRAYDGSRLVARTKVVVGTPGTPTPLGTFYITEKIARPPAGAYGPWILATSAYSEVLDSFDGGLPQVAFHGTNRPSLIGTQSSNGCIRMPDAVDLQLHAILPAGTPVTIVA